MKELGFRLDYLGDGRWVKVREDGRRGLAVGDEVALWEALQSAKLQIKEIEGRLAEQDRTTTKRR